MIFDPFGDFEERGYLRNHVMLKDLDQVKILEHISFLTHLDSAFDYLSSRDYLEYGDVLRVHGILFSDIYPWAGQDRAMTASREIEQPNKEHLDSYLRPFIRDSLGHGKLSAHLTQVKGLNT